MISYKKTLLTIFVYEHKCGGCSATYNGEIKRYFKVHICEHLEISHLTGKKVKIDEKQYKITFTVTTFLSFLKTFLFWPKKVMTFNSR